MSIIYFSLPDLFLNAFHIHSFFTNGDISFFLWLSGFPCSSDGRESACNAGDPGSIPGLGRYPGEGNGNPLQCSCLENPMDRGTWRATVHGVARIKHNLATKPPPPLYLSSIPLYFSYIFFILLYTHGALRLLSCLGYFKNVAVKNGVYTFFKLEFILC